jgi:beta-lactamase regulating signal transducer with metallopeptidase domain
MSRLFLIVLNMSITGSFVALAVMIARLLLKRTPKIFSYALWALVLFRLICPFSFESAVSLIPTNKEPIPQEIVYMQNPAINTGIKLIDNTVNNSIEESFLIVNQATNVNTVGNTIEIYAIIWLFGITVLLCYGFITYFRLKQRLSIAILVRDNIYETDLIKTAFVIGFIKPKIIIPINMSENEFDYIIKHEETHIKRFDYIIKPVAFLALIIHWFNPIIWVSYYLMAKDMEMSCDESVVKNNKEDIRVNYSSSLLALSANQGGLLSPLAFGEGNVKSRIKNVLNYKKPSFWIMILAVIIIVFVLISFGTDPQKIGEQSETVNNQNQGMDSEFNANNDNYKNEALGLSLNFPKEWEDKYSIEESENYISVFDKQIYDTGQGGLLFTINRTIGEMIAQQDMNMEPVPTKIILQGNGYTYFYRLPTDVNYPVNDEKLTKHYQEMSEQIDYAVQGISLLGEQKPIAANNGFKVVGSSYFTVEIPSEWDIKQLEYLPIWDIYEGNNPVGWIQMLPYEVEESISESVDDNAIREYLYNEETLRKMNITLRGNYADKSVMDKIKMSFKFTGGPFNVIDLQSTANLYIAKGCRNVFGMIDSFETENGNPRAVIVNVMELIPDGPDDNNPNGFRIENLKYTETYTLDHGVNVAALAPPNYNSYEMYYMPLLDENFIKNYDYKNYYFDFIVGSDGNLLVVLGHYIP